MASMRRVHIWCTCSRALSMQTSLRSAEQFGGPPAGQSPAEHFGSRSSGRGGGGRGLSGSAAKRSSWGDKKKNNVARGQWLGTDLSRLIGPEAAPAPVARSDWTRARAPAPPHCSPADATSIHQLLLNPDLSLVLVRST